MALKDNIQYLKGVGPKRAELLKKLDIETIGDLIYHLPRNYFDFTSPVTISDAVLDENNVILGRVVSKLPPARIRKGMTIYRLVFTDGAEDMTVVIYNSEFMFKSLEVGSDYILYGKVTGNLTSKEMSSPTVLKAATGERGFLSCALSNRRGKKIFSNQNARRAVRFIDGVCRGGEQRLVRRGDLQPRLLRVEYSLSRLGKYYRRRSAWQAGEYRERGADG